MIPLLFDAGATQFNTNGIGALPDAASCVITEERNGPYELELQYPVTGKRYAALAVLRIILAVPGDGQERQAFRIYKINRPINGVVTVYAQHISYQLSHIPCMPFTASSAAAAITGLGANAAEPCPFTFWTDVATNAQYKQAVPASIRSRLGGVEGSVLDVYGGEYEWDNYAVKLHASRGQARGVTLRYGKNITDLKQEENIANTVTGVCPYWAGADGGLITLPEKVVSAASAAKYPFPRTVPLDLSGEFEAKPSEVQLRAAAQAYISKSGIGVPAVNIGVSFAALWQTEEYKHVAPLERVKLCDTVAVLFPALGVEATAKVIATEYDVLLERYNKIEIGDAKSSLAESIATTEQEVKAKPGISAVKAAAANATSWITGANGGYVVMHKDANGQPYEILIMDTPDIDTAQRVWRWNKNGLGYSATGYNGTYGLAMTQDGQIVADYITTGTLTANLIKAGTLASLNGKTTIDMESGSCVFNGGVDVDSFVVSSSAAGDNELFKVYAWKAPNGRYAASLRLNNDKSEERFYVGQAYGYDSNGDAHISSTSLGLGARGNGRIQMICNEVGYYSTISMYAGANADGLTFPLIYMIVNNDETLNFSMCNKNSKPVFSVWVDSSGVAHMTANNKTIF